MIHIGTSGWSYDHWQGILYPEHAFQRERLSFYTQRFNTVELNSSFYTWSASATFHYWKKCLPPGFQLSTKAPRALTHSKRLYSPERWLHRIWSDLNILSEKRGIFLVQLSPHFEYDYDRLAYFIKCLPKGLRTSIEFRHHSWHHETVFQLLEQQHVAYCIMSGANLPCILRATSSFVYIRLHGPDHHHLYAGSYSDDDLRWWAARCIEWKDLGKEVYVYFNNDGFGNAVRNADRLIQLVSEY